MKRKILLGIIVALFITLNINCVSAATFGVRSSATTIYVGDTATITVSGTGVAGGPITISNSNSSVASISTSRIDWLENSNGSIKVTAKAVGTTTITIKGTVASLSNSEDEDTVVKTVTITVKEKQVANTNNNSNGSSTNKNNNTSSNKNNTTTTSKSSNANLKNMILSVEGLSPSFAKNITSYSLNVGENVNEVKVNATVEHSRASYSVSGNTNLKVGENVISVKVTAEDGTVKTYKINVLKSDDPVKSDATLSSVIIEDVDLGQTFDPNVTEYNAGDITVKADKLNIYAYPTNDNAKVEIIGNENLGVGENKITIKVTSENGNVTKEYTISFNKLYAEESSGNVDIYDDTLQTSNDKKSFWETLKEWYEANLKEHMTVIVLYVFVWVEFIQVVYLYERLKKYEDLDKITVGRRIEKAKLEIKKEEKKEKSRRIKTNPVFPEDEPEKKE